jgi:hypothetical protein
MTRWAKIGSERGLFDHLVGEGKQCWRDVEAETLAVLRLITVSYLGGRPHREVSRLLALEDANRRSLAARTGLGSGGESGH